MNSRKTHAVYTLALSPGLCSEDGYKAGVTDETEDGCGAVMKSHRPG